VVEQAYARILTHPGLPNDYWEHHFQSAAQRQPCSAPRSTPANALASMPAAPSTPRTTPPPTGLMPPASMAAVAVCM
jgi:hypothetical protein